MTLTQLIAAIRPIVADDGDASQTWSDELFTTFVNDGMRYIFDKYPDSRLASTGQTVASWADANADASEEVLCINDAYMLALVEYVVFRYYDRDYGDTRDAARAAGHLKLFQGLVSPRV